MTAIQIGEHTIDLPTLEELRAYYAALPPTEHFPIQYDSFSCLITEPANRDNERKVRVSPYFRPIIGLSDWRKTHDEGEAPLPDEYRLLAMDFDGQMANGSLTYAECIALIDEHIARRDAACANH